MTHPCRGCDPGSTPGWGVLKMIKGRELLSYLINDPFGESCLLASYLSSNNAEISYPLLITGIYHTTRMAFNRRRLKRHIKHYGLSRKIMEEFSKISWCSNHVARAYAFGAKRYSEFREIFTKYPIKYYIKKEVSDIAKKV